MTLHKHGGTKRSKGRTGIKRSGVRIKREKVPKRLRKRVSAKISKLKHEGKPTKQAIAQGINQTLSESKKNK